MILSLKYKIVRLIEKIPFLQLLIYNKLTILTFLLPHDKDFYALKLLFKLNETRAFLDIGGNNGVSALGFRKIGFKNNKILIFEPDTYLIDNYLNKIKFNFSKIKIYPFGLGKKNITSYLYKAFYKKKHFHFNNSFDYKYIKQKLKHNYPKKHLQFKIRKFKFIIKKFDTLKIKEKICFVKIDVEGYDHFVLMGMKNLIKHNLPVFLIEFNKSNFKDIFILLKKNYDCYHYNFDKNKLLRFNKTEVIGLKKGILNKEIYIKNSLNIFFLPKNTN